MALRDWLGRLVRPSDLQGERAGPTLGGVRSIWSSDALHRLTPERLAAILREAEVPGHGSSEQYLELAERMEETDPHYAGVLATRRRSVAGLGVRIEPASDAASDVADADLVRTYTARESMEDECLDLLDAIGKGYSVSEIDWEVSERQWMPRRLIHRLPQWFDFDREAGARLQMRGDAGTWEELAPWKFVIHAAQAKSGLPIRGGLARLAAWGWLLRSYALRDWVRFVEAYGMPIRLGRFGPGASQEDRDTLESAVRNVASDAAAIIPEGMMIEFVESRTAGARAEIYRDLIAYLDAQVSIAVLGQTLTTQAGEGGSGSYALGQVHDTVRRDIERSDARQLAQTLRRDLVIPIVALNHGPRAAYPRVVIDRQDPADVDLTSQALQRLVPLGLRVRADEVRALVGMEAPAADDEVLAPPASPMPAPDAPARRSPATVAIGTPSTRPSTRPSPARAGSR